MTVSHSTITRHSIQKAAEGLGSLLVEAANALRQIVNSVGQAIRACAEKVARHHRNQTRPVLRPFIERARREIAERKDREIATLRDKVQDLCLQLELRKYTEQDWFST